MVEVMQISKTLSIDQLITDPWALMKGKKRYFWLLFLPTLIIAAFGVYEFSDFLVALGTSVAAKNFSVVEHYSFSRHFGDLSTGEAVMLCLLVVFVFLYTYFGGFILGCDVAKGIPFSWNKLGMIFKRMWPGIVALIVIEIIKMVFLLIPVLGWILNFLFDPFFVLYVIATIYQQGPFSSLPRAWRAMKGNFWRLWVGYYVVVVITVLLCMTLIGAIWGIPFMMIAFGIVNRELLEK